MNATKRNVRIRLTTVHGGNRTVVEASGESYVKGKHTYIRFTETAPDFEGVVTLVKAGEDGVSVLRQGKVRMEQRYIPGKPAGGYYEAAGASFRLETMAERVDVRFANGVGTASWSYTLTVGGEDTGRFQVNLDVREDAERT